MLGFPERPEDVIRSRRRGSCELVSTDNVVEEGIAQGGRKEDEKSHSIERKHETHTLLLKMQAEIEIDRG